jgi:hypothetical protein
LGRDSRDSTRDPLPGEEGAGEEGEEVHVQDMTISINRSQHTGIDGTIDDTTISKEQTEVMNSTARYIYEFLVIEYRSFDFALESLSHPAVEQLRPIVFLRADPGEHIRARSFELNARDAFLVRPSCLDSLNNFAFGQGADLLAAYFVAPAQLHAVLRAVAKPASWPKAAT